MPVSLNLRRHAGFAMHVSLCLFHHAGFFMFVSSCLLYYVCFVMSALLCLFHHAGSSILNRCHSERSEESLNFIRKDPSLTLRMTKSQDDKKPE